MEQHYRQPLTGRLQGRPKEGELGTNYYWYEKPPCECCNRPYEPIHIGKSSAGWCFSLHVIPEDGINDLPDWEGKWNIPGSYIENEYRERITPGKMREIITNRNWPHSNKGFDYHANYAEPGPNNLNRHLLEPRHCIKHGAGTWDCIVGEFS